MNTDTYNPKETVSLAFKSNITHEINLNFFPTLSSIHGKLLSLKTSLNIIRSNTTHTVKISTNSNLILLLIPLILPIKDRLKIEFCFHASSKDNLIETNYEESKNFKHILEASQTLSELGLEVIFSKSL